MTLQQTTAPTAGAAASLVGAVRLSRLLVLACVVGAIAAWGLTGTAPWAASGPVVVGVAAAGLVLGLPHGALDHVLAVRLTGWRMPVVLTAYVAAAAAAWLVLELVGLPALLAVLALSLAHFVAGEVEVARATWGWPSGATTAGALTAGALGVAGTGALLVPLARADRTLLDVATAISPSLQDLLLEPLVRLGLVAAWGVAALVVVRAAWRAGLAGPLMDVATLGALAITLPPLAAFGIWFGAWHGLRHLARLLTEEPGAAILLAAGRPRAAVARLARVAWWPSLAASGALVLVVLATATADRPDVALGQAVQVLLALTVPHMAVVLVLDRRGAAADAWVREPRPAPRA